MNGDKEGGAASEDRVHPSSFILHPSSGAFARNVSIIFSSNVLMLLCGVVTSLLTARALGAEGRGELAIVVMYPNVIAMVAGIGLPQAHRYWAARTPERVSALFSNSLLFAFVIGLVAFGAAELFLPLLVGERAPQVMWLARIYMVNVPASLLHDLLRGLLEGAQEFKPVSLARVVFFGLQACVYVLLFVTDRLTIESAMWTMIAAQTAATSLLLAGVWRVLRPRWRPSRAVWRDSLRFGFRDYPGVLTEFTTMRLDQIVLGRFAASEAIGLYFVAVRLSEMTTVLASSVADAVMPRIASTQGQGRSDERDGSAAQMLARSLRLTFGAQMLVSIPLWIGAPLLLRVVYGAEFAQAAGVLRLLLVASLVWSAGAIVVGGLSGFGHPQASTRARLAAAAVTIILLALLLPRYGIMGAAIASLAGYAVMLIVALRSLVRRSSLRWSDIVRLRADDLPLDRVIELLGVRFGGARVLVRRGFKP